MIPFLYDIIYTVPLCLAAAAVFFPFLDTGKVTSCLIAAVLGIVFALFYHMKTRGRIILAGICAALAAGLVFARRTDKLDVNPKIFALVLISMGCFVLVKAAGQYIRIKAAVAALALVLLAYLTVNDIKPEKITVVSAMFFILVSLAEIIQVFWKKEGDTDAKKHIVCVFPFILSVMLIPMIASFPEKPYDWKFFKDLAGSIRNGYEIVISSVFSDRGWDAGDIMGFSDKAVIGGRVQGRPYKALSVSTDSYNDHRLYLGGRSFDTFNGRGWEKNDDSVTDYGGFDLIETYAAANKAYPDNVSGLLRKIRMHIVYEGVRTKYVFTPEKCIPSGNDHMTVAGGDLCFPASKRADYFIDYYRQNRDCEEFIRMLKEGQPLSEKDWQQALFALGNTFESGYSYTDYLGYKERIKEIYCGNITLSDRTNALLDDILEGTESDYEKLERIEKYLSGFTYTRQPGELPENISTAADFTDYLLFEKKEGFCTHFATAFVLLARSQGIPARYIQGYSTLSSSTRFEVLTDRAHAWPEAYIEGKGWISFEPTPGFARERGWGSAQAAKESIHTVYAVYPEEDRENMPVGDEKAGAEGRRILSMIGRRLLLSLVFFAGFIILFVLSDLAVKKYRFGKMNDREKILTLCRRNMRLLKRAGFAQKPGETLAEFSARAGREVPPDILSFIGIYEKLLYSKNEETPGDICLSEQCGRECSRFVRSYYAKRIRSKFF